MALRPAGDPACTLDGKVLGKLKLRNGLRGIRGSRQRSNRMAMPDQNTDNRKKARSLRAESAIPAPAECLTD